MKATDHRQGGLVSEVGEAVAEAALIVVEVAVVGEEDRAIRAHIGPLPQSLSLILSSNRNRSSNLNPQITPSPRSAFLNNSLPLLSRNSSRSNLTLKAQQQQHRHPSPSRCPICRPSNNNNNSSINSNSSSSRILISRYRM